MGKSGSSIPEPLSIGFLACEVGETSGGKGRYASEVVTRLSPLLVSEGHHVSVLVSSDASLPNLPKEVTVRRLPFRKNASVIRTVSEELLAPLWAADLDLLVALSSRLPLLPIPGPRVLTIVHDIHPIQHHADPGQFPADYTKKTLIYRVLGMEKALSRSDKLVTISKATRQAISDYCDCSTSDIAVIPDGVDLDVFHPSEGASSRAISGKYGLPEEFFLFVGGKGRKKNFRLVQEAYQIARSKRMPLPPVAVVGGERRDAEVSPSGGSDSPEVSDCFHLLGFVPESDLVNLYREAECLIHPSHHEGFGLPPLEAMACGTPVVASDSGALPEVVQGAGIFINAKDPHDLLSALTTVRNPEIQQRLQAQGKKRAREFGWGQVAGRLLEEIMDLTPNGGQ